MDTSNPDRWSTFTSDELDEMERGILRDKLNRVSVTLLIEMREHRKRYKR